MYLKNVTLKNFRCFEELKIDLHPQLTVLVGVNGAGKTAILDGIAAGMAPMLRYLSSANQRLSAAGAGIRDTDFRLVPLEKKANAERWGASEYAQVIIETTDELRWDEWRASIKSKGIAPPNRIGCTNSISSAATANCVPIKKSSAITLSMWKTKARRRHALSTTPILQQVRCIATI